MNVNVDLKAFRDAIAHDDGNLVLNDKKDALVKQNRGTGKLSKYTRYVFEQTKGSAAKNTEVRNALYNAIKATHDEEACRELMDRIRSRLGLVDGDNNAGKRTELLKRGEVRAILAEVDRWDAEKERLKDVVEGIMNWKLPDPTKKGSTFVEMPHPDNATGSDKDMQFVLGEVMRKVDAGRKGGKDSGSVIDSCLAGLGKEDVAKVKSEIMKSLQHVCLKKIVEDYGKNSMTELMVRVDGDKAKADNGYRNACVKYLDKVIDKAADAYANALDAIERRLQPYVKLIGECDSKIEELMSKTGDQAKPKAVAQLKYIRQYVGNAAVDTLQGEHLRYETEGSRIAKSICALAFADTDPAAAAREQQSYDKGPGATLKLLNRGFRMLDDICSNGDLKDDEIIDKFQRKLREDEVSKGIDKALSDKGPKGFRDNLKFFGITSDKLRDYVLDETKSIYTKDGSFLDGDIVNIMGMSNRASSDDVVSVCDSLNEVLVAVREHEEMKPMTDVQLKQAERDASAKFDDPKDFQKEIDKTLKKELRYLAYKQTKEKLNVDDVGKLNDVSQIGTLRDTDTEVYDDLVKTYDGLDKGTRDFFDRITTKMPKQPAEGASPEEKELVRLRTAICSMYTESKLFGGEDLEQIVHRAASIASAENRKQFVRTGVNPLKTVEGKVAMCRKLLDWGAGTSKFTELCFRAKQYAGVAELPGVKHAFGAMSAAAANMEEVKLTPDGANWADSLKALFTFDKLPALKEAFERYGSFSPAEEHLKNWCDQMIDQIKRDFADHRFSLCDRIAQLGIKDHIDIVDGKPLPKEVQEFVDGSYLKGLVNKAIDSITAGAKRFLEGMGRLEQKIQQIAPAPEEFFAGKADEKNGPVKFTLKALAEACDQGKEFALNRGLPDLVRELTRQLRADGPLLNPFRDKPADGENLWQEIDGKIADFVRNVNVSTFAKRDEIKDYHLFSADDGKGVSQTTLESYVNKVIKVRIKTFQILDEKLSSLKVGQTYDATDANYSTYLLFKSLRLPDFSGKVATDKGFLTNIGKEPMGESERNAKLAERQKVVDMNLLFEKALVRKLTAKAEKASAILKFAPVTDTVAEELTEGMLNAVSGCENAFKQMILDKADELFLNNNPQFLKTNKWINTVIKERAAQEAERFLVQGDDYRLDKAALAREVEKTIRTIFMNSVEDGKGNHPFAGLSAALAAPGNKASFVRGVDALRQNSLKALKAYGEHLPSSEDLWTEYLQAGPFAAYAETDKSGRIFIAEAKMSAMLKALQKSKGNLVQCVNEDFTKFANQRIAQSAEAIRLYETDVKTALHTKKNTGLLDRFGLPADYPANLPHGILLKDYLAGVTKPGKGVDTVTQLQSKILESEAGRKLVEAGIRRINDQFAKPESQDKVRNGWTVTSPGMFSTTTTTYPGLSERQKTIKQGLGVDFDPKDIFGKILERTVRLAVQDTKPGKDLSVPGMLQKAMAELDLYLDLAIANLKPVKKQAEEEKSFAKADKAKLETAIQTVLKREMSRIAGNLDLESRTINAMPNDIREAVGKILFPKVNNQSKA